MKGPPQSEVFFQAVPPTNLSFSLKGLFFYPLNFPFSPFQLLNQQDRFENFSAQNNRRVSPPLFTTWIDTRISVSFSFPFEFTLPTFVPPVAKTFFLHADIERPFLFFPTPFFSDWLRTNFGFSSSGRHQRFSLSFFSRPLFFQILKGGPARTWGHPPPPLFFIRTEHGRPFPPPSY